jgi:hypothetical protein
MKKAFFVAKVFNFIHQFDDLPMICKKKLETQSIYLKSSHLKLTSSQPSLR